MLGVIQLRKLYILWLAILMIVPFFCQSTQAATVTNVRWVTRNDAPVPFLRMVVDVSSPVKAGASINNKGKSTTITLKDAKLGNVKSSITMDKSIATSAKVHEKNSNVEISIDTPNVLDVSDIKVFSLKKDTINNKPYRIVVDIQKKGVSPRTNYYGKAAIPSVKPKVAKPVGTPPTSRPYTVSGGIQGKLITIDPGHGGSDPGAIGHNGLQEKQVTLPIAMYLKSDLEAMGAKVILTRSTDKDVYAPNASGIDELQARADVANQAGSDIFISVHINSFDNPSVGGIATYYYGKTSHDEQLARHVQNEIAGEPGFNGDRGIQPGNLYVLRNTTMPAILVELGFISNPTEESLLTKDTTRREFAKRIADGLAAYFK